MSRKRLPLVFVLYSPFVQPSVAKLSDTTPSFVKVEGLHSLNSKKLALPGRRRGGLASLLTTVDGI